MALQDEQPNAQMAPLAVDATRMQRFAPVVVGALLTVAVGAGGGAWRTIIILNERNAQLTARVQVLEQFMLRGKRCTRDHCDSILESLQELELELRAHDQKEAHREAKLQIQEALERSKRVEQMINSLYPHLYPGPDLTPER